MESIIREVYRRGIGHCTWRKPQSFKKVIKTGERFWISAEVESRQKYHSPRILMSTLSDFSVRGKATEEIDLNSVNGLRVFHSFSFLS